MKRQTDHTAWNSLSTDGLFSFAIDGAWMPDMRAGSLGALVTTSCDPIRPELDVTPVGINPRP